MKDDEQMRMAMTLVKINHPLHKLKVDSVLPFLTCINFLWRDQHWSSFNEFEQEHNQADTEIIKRTKTKELYSPTKLPPDSPTKIPSESPTKKLL